LISRSRWDSPGHTVGAFSFVEVDTTPDAVTFAPFPRDLQALRLDFAGAAYADRLAVLEGMPVGDKPQLGVNIPARR
jgi:hypothetical protein